jgi:hypothetical protein
MATLADSLLWALSPVEFARAVPLPGGRRLELDPWQRELIESTAPETVACTSRQVGKSTAVAVLALHEALFRPPALVLVLAGVFRQSGELYAKIRHTFEAVRQAPGISRVVDYSASRMTFANGSRVVCLPGNPAGVRGYSAPRLVVVDECAFAPDALLDSVRPMLATSEGGRLALISTPNGQAGAFFDAWEDPDPGTLKLRVRADECPRIPAAFLERERRKGDRYFRREFCAEFVEGVDTLFRYEDIAGAMSTAVEPLFPDWQ